MSRRAAWITLLLLSCGPKPGSDSPEPSPSERAEPSEVEPNACPRRFDFAMHDGACEPGSAACSYAEADCECVPRYPCSGVDPGPIDSSTLPHVWTCNIKDPSVLRPDGCPAMLPVEGAACRGDRVCHYSPWCGGVQSTARCVDASWQLEQQYIAPPPSAEG